ncbi:MAG: PLP-dependent aminotransferase family protein [Burkholderiales bacterium]|nr:MAG: PLP-dependent aminotransferase family protein [Burkholderiales bacterium]
MDDRLAAELIRRLFELEPRSHGVQRRLYLALRHAVLRVELPGGAALPASRMLSAELGIGRSTVVRVYEQLLAEGYLRSATGSGTFVSDSLRMRRPSAGRSTASMHARTGLSTRGSRIAAQAGSSPFQAGAFVPGVPDVSHFPFAIWRRLVARQIRHERRQLAHYGFGGYGPLRQALAEYLRVTRMMSVRPQQILILNGAHQAIDLCARMLCDEGDSVWMEDPGYWGARSVLDACGLSIDPVAVDEQGMDASAALEPSAPRLIFVSPSSQYPTGVVMSLERRLHLLERARAAGAWIIEDDYDNELRYHPHAVGSLFGLDPGQKVIYVRTFSKVMFPGLRLAYLVVPERLVDPFARGNAELYREGRMIEQAAMAEFIDAGHFTRHLRRMRGLYQERRDRLSEAIESRLGGLVVTHGGQAGLHLLYRFTRELDDAALADRTLREGIVFRPLTLYYRDPARGAPGMNLGFAAVPVERMAPAVDVLAGAIEAELQRAPRHRTRSGG